MLRGMTLAGLLTVGILCTGLAFADDTKPAKGDGKPAAKAALPPHFRQLGLNDEQAEKVKSIHADFQTKIDELNKQLQQLRDKQHEEIAKVLSEQQKERLKQILAAGALGKGSGGLKMSTPNIRSATDGDDKKDEKKEDKKEDKKDKK